MLIVVCYLYIYIHILFIYMWLHARKVYVMVRQIRWTISCCLVIFHVCFVGLHRRRRRIPVTVLFISAKTFFILDNLLDGWIDLVFDLNNFSKFIIISHLRYYLFIFFLILIRLLYDWYCLVIAFSFVHCYYLHFY